jgi:hypothetical protein
MITLAPRVDAAQPLAPALGRAAAVLTLTSAAVHVGMADLADLGSLALLGMALVCLPCAWHLWRSPTARVWGLTATLDATMLVLHLQGHATDAAAGGGLHAAHAGAAPGIAGLMWLAMALVGTQLVLAGLAALPRRAR